MLYSTKGMLGGDDAAQAAGHRDHSGGKLFGIAQVDHDRDSHGAHSRHCGRGGAGDSPVEQAGDDDGTGHAANHIAHEISKDVKELFGDAAPGHNGAGQHKHGDGQQSQAVDAAHHLPQDHDQIGREGVVHDPGQDGADAHGDRDGQAEEQDDKKQDKKDHG